MVKSRMEAIKLDARCHGAPVDISKIPREITDDDRQRFFKVIDTNLSPEQRALILDPPAVYRRQSETLAVHWHPEFVPMDLIEARLRALYPNMVESLIIPTQHNVLMSYAGYAGVEIDCYSHGFNRKVQLLIHIKEDKLDDRAGVLRAMCAHTLKYRGTQLCQLLATLVDAAWAEQRQKAASQTGADENLVEFCCIYGRKLQCLLDENWSSTPEDMVKNKLVRNYFDALKSQFGSRCIARAQVYLKAVKDIVKADFSLKYFYRASEIIEEARALGAGVVIPHPEQFWPILLADYDVDGVEVWNPQSSQYTDFLIDVIHRQNKTPGRRRPLLVFMGDDCHMSEKLLSPADQIQTKSAREIGLQPAWDDMAVRKTLIVGGFSRSKTIEEYRTRLG